MNVTFASDTASTGGEVDSAAGSTTIANSILVNSASCSGTIGDGGYNVESDNTCVFVTNDVVNSATINLATSLAANGFSGPETLAIGTNSSAFEEVAAACTTSSDERGDPRPGVAGAHCDAGAFEDQLGATSLSLAGAPVTGNNTYNVTLTVPSGGPAPSEPVAVKDSASVTCNATLTLSTATTYVGSCTIDNELAGEIVGATYDVDGLDTNFVESTSNLLAVQMASQAILFTSTVPTSPAVGTTYVVTATGGKSNNPVTFTIDASSTSGACTISGATVTFGAIGTCIIDANQAASTNYLVAPQVQQSVTVLAAGATPPPTSVTSGARIVIVQNLLTRSGRTYRETVKLACRNEGCTGLVKSIGQISVTKDVSVKSGPWTVTKKVTKVTKVVFASASYRLASGHGELLVLQLSASGRNVLAQAKSTSPVRETLTATAAGGNTATSNDVVR